MKYNLLGALLVAAIVALPQEPPATTAAPSLADAKMPGEDCGGLAPDVQWQCWASKYDDEGSGGGTFRSRH